MSIQSNIWKLNLFRFLRFLHFVSGILIPYFLDWGNISFLEVMILQVIFVFSIFLFEIPTGAIADKYGRKNSLILSSIVTSIAILLYSTYPHIILFVLAEITWALGVALMSGADEALLYDTLKELKLQKKSKEYLPKLDSRLQLGLLVAAPIGSVIAAKIGLQFAMMFMVVPTLMAMVIAFTLKEIKPTKKLTKNYLKTLKGGFVYFKNHKILRILAFDAISISSLSFLMVWLYQPIMTHLKISLIYFGIIASANHLVQIFFMHNFDFLEKLAGSKKNYLFLSALFTGIAFLLTNITQNTFFSLIMIAVVFGFGLTRMTLFKNYMHKFIESKNRATVISAVSMIEHLSHGVAYIFFGIMMEWSMKYAAISVGLLILIFSVISRVKEEHLID